MSTRQKLIIVFMVVSVLILVAIVSYAQEKNPYEEFKEVEYFSSKLKNPYSLRMIVEST